eukprot:TCONS_00052814-protein
MAAIDDSFKFEDTTLLEQLFSQKEGLLNENNHLFCKEYLENLSSYGLSKLAHEPETLREEHSNITQQTQNLAFNNYSTFIQAAECSKEIYKDFNIVEEHLDSVEVNLPKFANTIEHFSKSSQEINACRKQNSLVLSRHTQLLEVLEISQLMDTCVRNGYYEEALELANYVKRLERKFSQIKIITDIAVEVKRSTQYMLSQLLQQLKGNVQLPACLRIISYIRQLEVFTEAELRIKFLQGRDAWFQSVLSQIPRDDIYTHMTKVIDASRVSLFDIITQYNAIFSDNEPIYSSNDDKRQSNAPILHSWVLHKLSNFLTTLDEGISKGLHGRLDSLFGQTMYFGLSFSRIGADFRGLIVSLFIKHTLKIFRAKIRQVTQNFEDDMSTYTARSIKREYQSASSQSKAGNDPCIPPHELLDFPPMACYLNGVLGALNEFRQFPSLTLVFQMKKCLLNSLEKVMLSLENWARLESKSLPKEQSEDVKYLCYIVCRHFLPYIRTVFSSVFSLNSVQEMMGRTPQSVNSTQFKDMFTLDIGSLQNHLKEFVDLYKITSEIEQIENPKSVNDGKTSISLVVDDKNEISNLPDSVSDKLRNVDNEILPNESK